MIDFTLINLTLFHTLTRCFFKICSALSILSLIRTRRKNMRLRPNRSDQFSKENQFRFSCFDWSCSRSWFVVHLYCLDWNSRLPPPTQPDKFSQARSSRWWYASNTWKILSNATLNTCTALDKSTTTRSLRIDYYETPTISSLSYHWLVIRLLWS